MVESNDLKMFGVLFIALFVIGILVAVTYIGFDKLKDTACEIADSTYDWDGTDCRFNSSLTKTVTSITSINVVETGVGILLSLLALVIVVSIFKVVIKIAKGMKF